jgi:UV DNA damage endonuclease
MRYGICCIVLALEENDPPKKFQKMTYAKFSKTPRFEAVEELGKRILNNIEVTFEAIKFCKEQNYCYRLSSDLFPLVTYEKAEVSLEDFPNKNEIFDLFRKIKDYLGYNDVRVSLHPSEFNVLASSNEDAVGRTIRELNFYSWFMDQIGCPADYSSPINMHINNNQGSPEEIMDRFVKSYSRLDPNCQNRLVIENDDKINCWSANKLFNHYHQTTKKPITFDFLHHKCHSDGLSEREAFELCHSTWGNYKPLFHYSESRIGNNPRAHADYPENHPIVYRDADIDFEFKMKDKAIEKVLLLEKVAL